MDLKAKPCHIFLTGEKQVGKSSLIDLILQNTDLSWAGIKSISVCKESKKYIYLTDARHPEIREDHLVGICSNHNVEEVFPNVFDSYGTELLQKAEGVQLFVIDEVGFLENESTYYRNMLLQVLDRTDFHVIGVYRQDEKSKMYGLLRNHPNVKTFVIKAANRDNMAPVVNRLLHNIHRT